MKSFETTYSALFGRSSEDSPRVERIEIPLIQRDYAQGRIGTDVARIRARFLDVLHAALVDGEPVGLDFVYGDVKKGTLCPLDGQQRLTTLFLLHWYLAARADRLRDLAGWKHLTYATRPSARRFCERLVEYRPPPEDQPAAWIRDQPWYLFPWQHDPTVQSMLVVIDAIHTRFADTHCARAWRRLVDPEAKAISFHLLPIAEMGLNEDLYIKMNSRGKPLTPFETFKARFQGTLARSNPKRAEEFARKVDTDWSDVLWRYHGGDHLIDQEFLRVFGFATEVCAWRTGLPVLGGVGETEALEELAQRVYGPGNEGAAANLDFLMRAFDTWHKVDVPRVFERLFVVNPPPPDSGGPRRVVLYRDKADLFGLCCREYGQLSGRARRFTFGQTLLLYSVLLSRLNAPPDLLYRLRVVRNLVEASESELRLDRMSGLVADVEAIVLRGDLAAISAFNQDQAAEERHKADLLRDHPHLEQALYALEDHGLLRGCLAAFDLAPATLERRAAAFLRLFAGEEHLLALTGALLTHGAYARQHRGRFFHFGSSSVRGRWRELLTDPPRATLGPTSAALAGLLDALNPDIDVEPQLAEMQDRWLSRRRAERLFDWRYHLVRYPAMRGGASGRYANADGALGYRMIMLRGVGLQGYYRDPFLWAIYLASETGDAVEDPWFTSHEWKARWMRLVKSGVALRCIAEGIMLQAPVAAEHRAAFNRLCAKHGVNTEGLLQIPQRDEDGVDTVDRVQLGASLLRDLVAAGL